MCQEVVASFSRNTDGRSFECRKDIALSDGLRHLVAGAFDLIFAVVVQDGPKNDRKNYQGPRPARGDNMAVLSSDLGSITFQYWRQAAKQQMRNRK